jgi:hypothetical protein
MRTPAERRAGAERARAEPVVVQVVSNLPAGLSDIPDAARDALLRVGWFEAHVHRLQHE